MHHFGHWVSIAYKHQREQKFIEQGAVISRYYRLKSVIKLLQSNVNWERSIRKLKSKHDRRLTIISLASLKYRVYIKHIDANKFKTAEAFHEFSLKRRVIQSITKIRDLYTLPKHIEAQQLEKATELYRFKILQRLFNAFHDTSIHVIKSKRINNEKAHICYAKNLFKNFTRYLKIAGTKLLLNDE
jgi:hypothetical protein